MGKRSRAGRPRLWEQAGILPSQPPESESGEWSEDSDTEWYKDICPEEAGATLVELLVNLHLEGKLSAKNLCVLCFYAEKAGVSAAKDLSYKPDTKAVGHFSRHVGRILGSDKINSYKLKIPSHCKNDVTRSINEFDVMLPHEVILEEISDLPADFDLNGKKAEVWQQFREHTAFSENVDDLPVPLSMYLDGVPFTKNDSFLGIWISNLITGSRHILCLFRKSDLCRCGCKQWCSLYCIFSCLAWSLACMLNGCFPVSRHDGQHWTDHDVSFGRLATAGSQMSLKALVVLLKGDWSEFAVTLGFKNWASVEYPCMYCHCSQENRYDYSKLSALCEDQWQEVTQDDIEQACRVCEIRVTLRTKADHTLVRSALRFDKRKKGWQGRVVTKPLETLGLAPGDRLEPCKELPDVALFDRLDSFPVDVLFWRVPQETRVRHRNPLMWPETGITMDALAIDLLHTLHLGVLLTFSSNVVWALLLANIFSVPGGADEILQFGVLQLKSRLADWYTIWDNSHPDQKASRVTNFTVKMLGDRSSPKLGLRAAETYFFFFFILDLLKDFVAIVENGHLLHSAGQCLATYMTILKTNGPVLGGAVVQQLLDLCKKFLLLVQRAGWHDLPKNHLWTHLTLRAARLGNPKSYATFADESANGDMALVAASTHRMTFALKCYWKYSLRFGGFKIIFCMCSYLFFLLEHKACILKVAILANLVLFSGAGGFRGSSRLAAVA